MVIDLSSSWSYSGNVRRSPRMSISQWYAENALLNVAWSPLASCGAALHLPWTDDARPGMREMAEMAAVCGGCPVFQRCAHYALSTNNGRGVEGGFYAGHWIPWGYSTESNDTKDMRRRARLELRRIAATAGLLPPRRGFDESGLRGFQPTAGEG